MTSSCAAQREPRAPGSKVSDAPLRSSAFSAVKKSSPRRSQRAASPPLDPPRRRHPHSSFPQAKPRTPSRGRASIAPQAERCQPSNRRHRPRRPPGSGSASHRKFPSPLEGALPLKYRLPNNGSFDHKFHPSHFLFDSEFLGELQPTPMNSQSLVARHLAEAEATLERLDKQREELVAEIAALRDVMAKLPTSGVYVLPPPNERGEPRYGSKRYRYEVAIENLLREAGTMHRKHLFERLKQQGVIGDERDPLANISNILCVSDKFTTVGSGIWKLADATSE